MAEDLTALFKTIRRIQFQTDQLAKDFLVGAYKSVFKGRGMEFEEVRPYQIGDEVRDIDWKVTARMNEPYIKIFREERELTVMLAVDVSHSSFFGSKTIPKNKLIAEISALIAFSAIKNNDKIGLLLFSDDVEKYIPPGKGTRHVLRVIREVLGFKPKNKGTNLKKAADYLGKVLNKTGICFLISDFICQEPEEELALLAHKHDLISITVVDPLEISFPKMGLLNLVDLETGETLLVDSSDSAVQLHFKSMREQQRANHEKLMKKIGAGFITIQTDQPYLPPIQKFFKMRGKKL